LATPPVEERDADRTFAGWDAPCIAGSPDRAGRTARAWSLIEWIDQYNKIYQFDRLGRRTQTAPEVDAGMPKTHGPTGIR
jgi:hypothetical protein